MVIGFGGVGKAERCVVIWFEPTEPKGSRGGVVVLGLRHMLRTTLKIITLQHNIELVNPFYSVKQFFIII